MKETEENKKRDQIISFLIEIFKEEISLLQEIFGYVTQKEYFLLTGDEQMHHEMERKKERLKEKKEVLTGKRERILQEFLPSSFSLEAVLDVTKEMDFELLALHQKWEILTDKTESQELRNEALKELIAKQGKGEPASPAIQTESLHLGQIPGKLPLITIDYQEEEE